MKINFIKKENVFKKEKMNSNINFYWNLAVSFMFVVALACAVFGYHLFVSVSAESVPLSDGTSSRIDTIKKERIEKVLEYFSVRKQKSNQILNSSVPVVDPSL